MTPLIINLAPTGMVPTKAHSPHVPITPSEIVADAMAGVALGASMVHLHARDADGKPTSDSSVYAEIVAGIRARAPAVVIITSTSGRCWSELERRATTLYLEGDAKPDMASLTPTSMNFAAEASVNDPKTVTRLVEIMRDRGVRPEIEVFDLGMVNFAKILIDKGLIAPPFYFNILLGNPATAQATLAHVAAIIGDLPPQSIWSLAGIGRFQLWSNALGVVTANGVRVGLEDNLWLDAARTQLATNRQLVERIVAQATALGRPLAQPGTVRDLLGLEQRR